MFTLKFTGMKPGYQEASALVVQENLLPKKPKAQENLVSFQIMQCLPGMLGIKPGSIVPELVPKSLVIVNCAREVQFPKLLT